MMLGQFYAMALGLSPGRRLVNLADVYDEGQGLCAVY